MNHYVHKIGGIDEEEALVWDRKDAFAHGYQEVSWILTNLMRHQNFLTDLLKYSDLDIGAAQRFLETRDAIEKTRHAIENIWTGMSDEE